MQLIDVENSQSDSCHGRYHRCERTPMIFSVSAMLQAPFRHSVQPSLDSNLGWLACFEHAHDSCVVVADHTRATHNDRTRLVEADFKHAHLTACHSLSSTTW